MCSWSPEEASFLPWATGKLSSLGFSTCPLGVSAGNYIPLNQGFHGHEKSKPWVINTLPQCPGPWATAWLELCPTGFIPGLWPMLMDRAENQADNLAPICSCPRMIGQGFQQGLQHKHNIREAKGPHTAMPAHVPIPSGSTAGKTRLSGMCSHHGHISASAAWESLTPAAKAWLADYWRVHTSKRLSSDVPSFGMQPHAFAVC